MHGQLAIVNVVYRGESQSYPIVLFTMTLHFRSTFAGLLQFCHDRDLRFLQKRPKIANTLDLCFSIRPARLPQAFWNFILRLLTS